MSGESVAHDPRGRLRIVPVTLAEANAYTTLLHRHNGPLPSAKITVAAVTAHDGVVHGVAIAGLPKGRMLCDGGTIEVNRVCTDGTPNACSALYGACARAAKAMGYWRLVTYTLQSEPGTSLKASGWTRTAELPGRSWDRRNASKGQPGYVDQHDLSDKWRWELNFTAEPVTAQWPQAMTAQDHPELFEGVA